jgi:enoyl-CoA hydratase/carnithine racemase
MPGLVNPYVKFDNYKDKYQHIKLERRDGIVQMTIHTKSDTLKFSSLFHTEICDAFTNLGADHDNKALIVTGAGNEFCTSVDIETFADSSHEATARIHWEGRKMLTSLLDMEVPMIGAVNGPATVHAELGVMCDVVLCTQDATFADHPHFPAGVVPGDGVHVVWQHILGPNRGRYFMLMGQVILAQEALALGIVNEVLPRDQLLPRAWQVAHTLLEKPLLAVRYARLVLNQNYRRLMLNDLGYGLAVEMMGTSSLRDRG